MIKFSYVHYILIFILQAGVVISSFTNEFVNGADLGFTTHDQQDPISVPVAGDQTATVQGSTNAFDDSAVNPSNVQSPNPLLNGQFDPSSIQVHGVENTALLFDESSGGGEIGGTDMTIPFVPTQILEGVPEFIDAIGQWLKNRKKPECKVNKHLVCCQKGAPKLHGGKFSVGRAPYVEPKVHPELLEYSQRRRECRSYIEDRLTKFVVGSIGSEDHPACQWPENVFCCYCKDFNFIAYFCYNQPYTDLPEFQNNRPIPEPRQISKPPQDPNPVEQPSGSQKRDSIIDNGSSLDSSQNSPAPNTDNLLYAESDLFDFPATRGRKRKPETCADKFLESVGVSPYRYQPPPRPKQPESKEGGEGQLDPNGAPP